MEEGGAAAATAAVGVKFDYSAHTMAGCLMIPLHLGSGMCRLQALAAGDTGLAKC